MRRRCSQWTHKTEHLAKFRLFYHPTQYLSTAVSPQLLMLYKYSKQTPVATWHVIWLMDLRHFGEFICFYRKQKNSTISYCPLSPGYSIDAVWHALNKLVSVRHLTRPPRVYDRLCEGLMGHARLVRLLHFLLRLPPRIFDGTEIWRLCRPVHIDNPMLLQPLPRRVTEVNQRSIFHEEGNQGSCPGNAPAVPRRFG